MKEKDALILLEAIVRSVKMSADDHHRAAEAIKVLANRLGILPDAVSSEPGQ